MTGSGDSEELPYWLALRRAGLGSRNFALLLAEFSSIGAAWQAPAAALRKSGIEAQYVRAVEKARASFDPAIELARIEQAGARAYTWLDRDYPSMLRDIPQSPPVLFARGNLGPQFESAVAIVGTRGVTPYGRQVCETFCGALARAGVAIVSGLARGVDAIAHRVALECGAPTVAVLAGGIDQIYPRENTGLADRILQQGALVSEYPPGIPARPDYFPRRNRILSGLAQATLIIEAGEGSGALHTANWAFEQGRDVFAVPGSIFSRQSLGTNQLIRENTAKLVTTPEQLLEELNLLSVQGPQRRMMMESPETEAATATVEAPVRTRNREEAPLPADLPADEAALIALLASGPVQVDDLTRASGLGSQAVSGALTMLEIKGLVRQCRPMTYERVP